MVCLNVFLFGYKFFGTLWASWTSWKSISFVRLGTFSFIMFSNKFTFSCSSSSFLDTPMIQMLERLTLSQRFLSLSSFFWIFVSSFCSDWMFISSFCLKLLIWVPVSFPSLLVPYTCLLISLCIAFTFSSILWPYSTISISILIPSVLNSASDKWAISSCLVLFLEFWSILSLGPYILVSAQLLWCKGWSLRYLPGQGNPLVCVVVLSVGEGSEREQCCLPGSWPAFSHFPCYPQANWALLVLIPKWVGLCMFQDPVGLSNELSCETGSFSCHRNPHRFLPLEVLRLYFPERP